MKQVIFWGIFIISISLCGCSIKEHSVNEDNDYINNVSMEIICCFDEKDIDGLKSMFSLNSQNNFDLDIEIENAFNKYDGKSISYTLSNISWAGGKDNGKWIDRHFNPKIKNICTDKGMSYNIGFYLYEYDTSRIGIGAISLQDSEGNEIAGIGGWAE